MQARRRRGRVLVVDDAPFMRLAIRDILEAVGHEVVAEAADGDEGLELYERYRPDVVTLDLNMPRRAGIETLRELRTRHPEAVVVVCSSVRAEPTIREALRLGARDYVLKPVSVGKLREVVAKALGGGGGLVSARRPAP